MRILLITPPLLQFNTPYPAAPALAAFLKSRGLHVAQADLSLELILRLFSRRGVLDVARVMRRGNRPSTRHFLAHAREYAATVGAAAAFLQGRRPGLARRIASRRFLPEGPRFAQADPFELDRFPLPERARHLASLYVDDLADAIRDGVDPRFGLARYAERLAVRAPSFAPIRKALEGPPTRVDRLIDQIARELIRRRRPDLVGITVPFPGAVYGAFRIARAARRMRPRPRVVLGGGYVSTELRDLSDPRVFDYADYMVLDDGEAPLLALAEHLEGRRPSGRLIRTLARAGGRVVRHDDSEPDVPHRDKPAPDYGGLKLDRYLSMAETLNPMHRLWSDGRWNKLMLAHGCYWRRCAFCDTTLDYIHRFDPAPAFRLANRIEQVRRQTGSRDFHFTDEAAPPALLRALAEELVRRRIRIRWWCNIRFEKNFTPGLARLLARSGCIAVSGGLEAATDRLLRLMNKGITVAQARRVMKAFSEAGIMVHAYLMYGFPTQTAREILEALDTVRRLFKAGCLHSAYWHRFALTAHSPVAQDPAAYGIRLVPARRGGFARNELSYTEPKGFDHDRFGPGLRKAVYNFMHGIGFDAAVRSWFDRGEYRGRSAPRP
ncbi:MAG TPA: radical SAM protein [Kiritimatiellia bacterium]|nr:radical SAM protein [Kiritimatiellia bacterium]HRZ11214.1 radical SAM protein [Kiritimatiellia bacterium]HSA19065.1 radical SAM protein [Kiritimatiellia bacterium]